MKSRTVRFSLALLALAAAAAVTPVMAVPSKTFVVTSTGSSKDVPGTLTWAVYQANYQGGDINYINFNIPGVTGEAEIVLSEQLYIARPTVLNAATQSGSATYNGPPLIRINCNKFASGFTIVPALNNLPGGGGSTINGFRIMNYTSNAITIFKGANSNVITNNHIGWAPLKTPGTYFKNTSVSPECRGIGMESSSNVIRGNTISGVHNGITMAGDIFAAKPMFCRKNVIEHNFIGTDPTGTSIIGNDSDAIFLTAGAQENLIGPGNVLSGNVSAGVELLDAAATDNRIFGNMIGVNVSGTEALPNGELGILIANGASNNWVGGPYGGRYAGNVISASGFGAIAIGTSEFPGVDGSNDNHIEGNLIGSDLAETKALGTQVSGITIQNKSKRTIIRKNVIVGHQHHGIVLAEANSNELYGNWIGVTSKGKPIGNAGFAVYLMDASYNTVQLPAADEAVGTERNIFGAHPHGPIGLYGASIENIIDLSPTPPSPTPAPTAPPPAAAAPRLLNISTRMRVESGDNALIGGFIITGQSSKKVIVRGLGTSLTVDGALADPTLELNTSTASLMNDDWRSTQEQEISASGIPPASNLEPAIVATLEPGAYTAVLRGKGGASGVGLLEVYDLDSSAPPSLVNISTRGVVQTGGNVMIAGFILGAGNAETRVVVRALGPSLGAAGVSVPLSDPTLQLIDGNGTLVRQSDNWQDDAAQAQQLTTVGLTPANTLEAAVVATLPAGAYTAVVADKSGRAGTGLVEVYSVP